MGETVLRLLASCLVQCTDYVVLAMVFWWWSFQKVFLSGTNIKSYSTIILKYKATGAFVFFNSYKLSVRKNFTHITQEVFLDEVTNLLYTLPSYHRLLSHSPNNCTPIPTIILTKIQTQTVNNHHNGPFNLGLLSQDQSVFFSIAVGTING